MQKRSFLEALGDFLTLAALVVADPHKEKPSQRESGLRRGRWMEEATWEPVTSVAFSSIASFGESARNVLTELIPEGGAMMLLDEQARPHSFNNSPAVVTPDGNGKFFWHGVHVPEYVVKEPQLITTEAIDKEENQEIRRVMVERFGGVQKYIEQCGAKLVAKDEVGELYEKEKAPDVSWEGLKFVKVKNSTPEPDGSIKDYFIRVPPGTKTPKEGIAWTFQLNANTYAPQVET